MLSFLSAPLTLPRSLEVAGALHPSAVNTTISKEMKLADQQCGTTVAYTFLTMDTLPLEDAWREYFDGCEPGSYTVHIHAQNRRATNPGQLPEAQMAKDPVQGRMRFRYAMIEAELRLYRDAAAATAPNGCTPQWIQLLSESCAPIVSCRTFHDRLAEKPGVSLFHGWSRGITDSEEMLKRGKPTRYETDAFFKADQWHTAWMDHAKVILEHEEENALIWDDRIGGDGWLPDAHYVINMHHNYGLKFDAGKMQTMVSWGRGEHATRVKGGPQKTHGGGHPGLIMCSEDTINLMLASTDDREDFEGDMVELVRVDLVQQTKRAARKMKDTEFRRSEEHRVTYSDFTADAVAEFESLADEAVAQGASFVRKVEPECTPLIVARINKAKTQRWRGEAPCCKNGSAANLTQGEAPCYSADARAEWLVGNKALSQDEAKLQVMNEFPEVFV
tara:strand:+ start:75 stop:1412 length:1338 start_codon:yes stop_codon:yes gene_type:complete